jgi:hypothetical protein
MSLEDPMARASAAQAKYTDELMRKPNVVGVAVGLAKEGDQLTNDIALVVLVNKKVPLDQLAPEDRIPSRLDSVRVDVQEVGELRAY